MNVRPNVRLARERDLPGFLGLAAQVERWFGPMVDDPGFSAAVVEHIRGANALVVTDTDTDEAAPPQQPPLLGGLLFGSDAPTFHIHWLVVSQRARGQGIGAALMADAMKRYVTGPGTVEVVTFGADHPGAVVSGARVFYERLGFTPAEATDPGPEGGSRQIYRLAVT
ncbi:GNAT family N-acetyltransferase [Streptomyces sp. NBC_01506]|uniref:GNAT family N-acetyltransferase n=1 Tax=Streptomyces sp. NBC_01506 TaxID=2903887 RepID=UPI0038695930